jgi:hypothetical protein
LDNKEQIDNLEKVMDRVVEVANDRETISVDDVLSAIGQRSFGSVLLLVGLIVLAPIIGDIPGAPTICAIMVLLFSVQLMMRREYFWLPKWMLNRTVKTPSLHKAVELSRKPARFIDKLVKPRLTFLIRNDIATRCVAIASMATALMMPPMELIPFSANLAGAVLTCFGLALIARDGLFALLAFTLTGASATVMIYGLFG